MFIGRCEPDFAFAETRFEERCGAGELLRGMTVGGKAAANVRFELREGAPRRVSRVGEKPFAYARGIGE